MQYIFFFFIVMSLLYKGKGHLMEKVLSIVICYWKEEQKWQNNKNILWTTGSICDHSSGLRTRLLMPGGHLLHFCVIYISVYGISQAYLQQVKRPWRKSLKLSISLPIRPAFKWEWSGKVRWIPTIEKRWFRLRGLSTLSCMIDVHSANTTAFHD